ncbi:MAG: hypothetical protein IPJ01_10350 [Micavibrio sp.]|nr:hypothetical protein [Micavibrio sp.]
MKTKLNKLIIKRRKLEKKWDDKFKKLDKQLSDINKKIKYYEKKQK